MHCFMLTNIWDALSKGYMKKISGGRNYIWRYHGKRQFMSQWHVIELNSLAQVILKVVVVNGKYVINVSAIVKSLQVWPSDHREEDRSCAWSFYSLVQIFPKALHWRWGLYDGNFQTSLEETRPWPSSPLIVSRDSFSLWACTSFQTGGA